MNRELTSADVWRLWAARCNAHEIATYAGVQFPVAVSMVIYATDKYSKAEPWKEDEGRNENP